MGLVTLALTAVIGVWMFLPMEMTGEFEAQFQESRPERHIVPAGYKGWLVVEYGVDEAEPIPVEDGVAVFHYPESGALPTSTEWRPVSWERSKNRRMPFCYHDRRWVSSAPVRPDEDDAGCSNQSGEL